MEKVRFAVIGCGSIAYKHAEAIRSVDMAELTAACDKDEEKARAFAGRYGVHWTADYKQLLKAGDFDVVSICTPSYLHLSMALAAARSGKHVLVEKPMALSLKDADTMIECCSKLKVHLSVVLQNRFKPVVIALKKAVDQGLFGRMTLGNAAVRWNRNSEYYLKSGWRGCSELGGGVLVNQAIHNIDLLQWLMGPVKSVYASSASRLFNLKAEDVAGAVLKFENGALGVIEAASTIYPTNLEESISIFGETGTAVIGGTRADCVKVWNFLRKDAGLPPSGPVNASSHIPCIEDMVRSVQSGKIPLVDGQEGRKSLEIVLAMHRSAQSDRVVVLS